MNIFYEGMIYETKDYIIEIGHGWVSMKSWRTFSHIKGSWLGERFTHLDLIQNLMIYSIMFKLGSAFDLWFSMYDDDFMKMTISLAFNLAPKELWGGDSNRIVSSSNLYFQNTCPSIFAFNGLASGSTYSTCYKHSSTLANVLSLLDVGFTLDSM